jgi:hypothetical protein
MYFAYGTNMNMESMAIRCPTAKPIGWAGLSGWRLIINTDGWPTIVPCPGTVLYGALWKLTDEDEAALDFYEDISGGLYSKQELVVTMHNDQSQSALVYIAANSTAGHYAEKDVLADILHGAVQFELPSGYMRYLRCHFKENE